jgi:two-component system chemotaxis response regulator CheY
MSKTILIVDDSTSLRMVVKGTLESEGCTVLEASDGNAALALMDGRHINMIISDVNMPGMGGLEFAAKAKTLPFYKFTPILMLTTEVSADKKEIAKNSGVKAWMTKPFSPSSILNAVSKLC